MYLLKVIILILSLIFDIFLFFMQNTYKTPAYIASQGKTKAAIVILYYN